MIWNWRQFGQEVLVEVWMGGYKRGELKFFAEEFFKLKNSSVNISFNQL